jgi:hypothetical protein
VALTVGLLACLSLPASAQNLVVNPGFETSEFYPDINGIDFGPGWYHTSAPDIFIERYGSSSVGPDSRFCHSGDYSAFIGNGGSEDGTGTLFQTLTTTPGQMYTFELWAGNAGDGSIGRPIPNPVDVYWNGQRIDTLSNLPFGFSQHTYTVAATAATTEIKFQTNMRQDTEVFFDDVSVIVNPQYDLGTRAFYVNSNATFSSDISGNEVMVGKDKNFNTVSDVTLKVTDGARITQYGNNVYPDGVNYVGLHVFGDNQADIGGGLVELANGNDTGIINISGGEVNDVVGRGSSTINISGGNITDLVGEFTSTINITGGTTAGIDILGNSLLNISGGTITGVIGNGSTITNITGGTITQIKGFGNSEFHITGGILGGDPIGLHSNAILTLTGTELSLSDGVAGSDVLGGYIMYTLGGTLQGGQSINGVQLFDYDGGLSVGDPYSGSGNLRFFASASPSATAPEPGTLALLTGVGCCVFGVRRRRTGRNL